MKLLFRTFLLQVFLVAQLAPYASYAKGPGVDFRMVEGEVNSRSLYFQNNSSSARIVNEYRLLGFGHVPDITNEAFRHALKTESLLLRVDPAKIQSNAQYKALLETSSGRRELIRQGMQATSAISVVTGENLEVKFHDEKVKIERQLMKTMPYDANMTEEQLRERVERITIERNRQLLEKFDSEIRQKADQRIENKTKKILSNARERLAYGLKNGLASGTLPRWFSALSIKNQYANAKGQTIFKVKDQFGKPQNIAWSHSAEGMKDVKPVKLLENLKKGSIETGRFGMIFLVIMFGSAGVKMVADYNANPRAFEEMLDQTLSWAMPLSLASFFMGGAGTQVAVDALNVRRKALVTLNNLEKSKTALIGNKELYSKLLKSEMAVIEKTNVFQRLGNFGLSGGFLASKFIFKYVDKLESCRKVLATDSGRYNKFERARFKQSCQQTFLGIAAELAKDPKTYMELTALLSSRAIMSFGMSKLQFQKYHYANKEALAKLKAMPTKSFKHSLRIVARGAGVPFVTSLVTFGVFTLVFIAIMWLLEIAYDHLSHTVPAERVARNIREVMDSYRRSGWDMNKLCDDRTLLEGAIIGNIKALWNNNREKKCGDELLKGFFAHHGKLNTEFRGRLLKPVSDSITKWNEYLFQATNMYQASYLLYKDVVEQIKVQKASGKKIDFKKINVGEDILETLGYANTHLYKEALPLFRSEPFFGWSYKMNDGETEEISYPIVNGTTTTWSERINDQEKIGYLEKRMENFKKEVVPQVQKSLESIEKRSKWFHKHTREVIVEINALVKSPKFENQVYGFQRISEEVENEMKHGCRSFIAPGEPIKHECVFTDFQKPFMDMDFYKEGQFGKLEYAHPAKFYAGYKTSSKKPYGVKPVGPGQRFFMSYYSRLDNNGIDSLHFPVGYSSLTDYLLKQMVCGVNVDEGESMLTNEFWYKIGTASPKFIAPRISLNKNVNPCGGPSRALKEFHNKGWKMEYGFYSFIEDGVAQKSYGGVVDFLYNEITDDVVNDFDGWWDDKVKPQFAAVVDKMYKEYFLDEVIDQRLDQVLTKQNRNVNCESDCEEFVYTNKKGVAASLKQELDTYFTYTLMPMAEDLPLITKHFEGRTEGRLKLMSDLKLLKNRIYDIFNYVSDRTDELLDSENQEIYADILEQTSAEQELLSGPVSQAYEVMKLKSLKVLLFKRFYELRILFQTDFKDFLRDQYVATENLIHENDEISESQKEELIVKAKVELAALRLAFNSYANRDGKIILDYKDWVGTGNKAKSDTKEVISRLHTQMQDQFDELIQLQMLKYSLSSTGG